jgi:hypothetical protein
VVAQNKPLPSLKESKVTTKKEEWDAWGEPPQSAPLETTNIDYNSLNLNKLSDSELKKHKASMDKVYNKNFVGKNDPNF